MLLKPVLYDRVQATDSSNSDTPCGIPQPGYSIDIGLSRTLTAICNESLKVEGEKIS
jgi:hypothetical protein